MNTVKPPNSHTPNSHTYPNSQTLFEINFSNDKQKKETNPPGTQIVTKYPNSHTYLNSKIFLVPCFFVLTKMWLFGGSWVFKIRRVPIWTKFTSKVDLSRQKEIFASESLSPRSFEVAARRPLIRRQVRHISNLSLVTLRSKAKRIIGPFQILPKIWLNNFLRTFYITSRSSLSWIQRLK